MCKIDQLFFFFFIPKAYFEAFYMVANLVPNRVLQSLIMCQSSSASRSPVLNENVPISMQLQ